MCCTALVTDIANRMAFSILQRTMLLEELMLAASRFARENFQEAEFVMARYPDREFYEPWFELCLPEGVQLRVNVEVRAI